VFLIMMRSLNANACYYSPGGNGISEKQNTLIMKFFPLMAKGSSPVQRADPHSHFCRQSCFVLTANVMSFRGDAIPSESSRVNLYDAGKTSTVQQAPHVVRHNNVIVKNVWFFNSRDLQRAQSHISAPAFVVVFR
jgi:hypothetical protein